jgi:ribonuclease D
VIDTERALLELLPDLRKAEWVAVDTEADSLHSYPEKLCLIQISVPDRDVLVDPLAGLSLDGLLDILRERELIIHGADYDLRLMFRAYGFVPRAVFDTMLAAKLLGYSQLGLDALAARLLNVKLEKGPQKANWARRPLTERMAHYARNDTRYLQPMASMLRAELEAKLRNAWHLEICGRLVRECSQTRTLDREEAWRIKGASELDPPALAVLRSLWLWREREALRHARPPFFILPHENLVAMAGAAAKAQPIASWLPPRISAQRLKDLQSAVDAALVLPPSAWPSLPRRNSPRLSRNQKRKYEDLRRIRDLQAARLGIEPSVIASRAALVGLATERRDDGDDLMCWQRELLTVEPQPAGPRSALSSDS